jgi:hypothetical protein
VGDVAVDSLSVYNNEALRRFRVQMASSAQTGWDLVIRIDAGCSILRPLEPLTHLAPTADRVYGEGDFLRVSLSLEETAAAPESIPLCAVCEQEGEVARAVHDFATENGHEIEFIPTRNPYSLFCFLKS